MAYSRGNWAPTPYHLSASEHSLPPPSPMTGGGHPHPPPPHYYSNLGGYGAPPPFFNPAPIFNSSGGYALPPPFFHSLANAAMPSTPAAPFFPGWNHPAAMPSTPAAPFFPGWNYPAAMRPVHPPPPTSSSKQRAEVRLKLRLRRQIVYYFSKENLVKDEFLRRQMDAEGWVSVHLIAGFPKVKELTDDVGLIMMSVRHSSTVEAAMADGKMRKRGDWKNWLFQ